MQTMLCLIVIFGALLAQGGYAEPSAEVQQYIRHASNHFLISNVRIVDGTGTPARTERDVLIENGRIKKIEASGQLQPGEFEVIDATGMTLLPGYVMMHEHLMYTANANKHFFVTNQPISFPKLYLAAGVTTARTAGGVNVSQDLNIAHEIRANRLVGPNFDVTSPHMVGGLPDSANFPYGTIGLPNLVNPAGAIRFVDYWAGLGVTSFKAHTHVAKSVMRTGIRAAHRKKMKFTAHLCSVTYREAALMGIDNIEHGFFEMSDFVESKKVDDCPDPQDNLSELSPEQPKVAELIDLLIDKNVAITSTLPVFVRAHKTLGSLPLSALELLDGPTRIAYLQRRARAIARSDSKLAAEDKKIRVAMSLTKSFHDKGGHLMVGTDPTGMGGTIAGHANFEAIELLVEAGLTPLQAIKAATWNGAKYLGQEKNIGSIAVGKQADLVMVRGAPDQNIKDVRQVELVFKRGIGFDSKKLFESARGTIGAPGS